MKELALHVLDLAENSIRANASLISISIKEDFEMDILSLEITDDGDGMDEELLKSAHEPFTTTRETRGIGLGLPLIKFAALSCEGTFRLESEKNKGTRLYCSFKHSHIDRAPIGNMADTIISLLNYSEKIDIVYSHRICDNEFKFDSREIKVILDGVSLQSPDILLWIKDYIKENIKDIYDHNKKLYINPYKTILFDKKMI